MNGAFLEFLGSVRIHTGVGRPPYDRAWLANAFVAKTVTSRFVFALARLLPNNRKSVCSEYVDPPRKGLMPEVASNKG